MTINNRIRRTGRRRFIENYEFSSALRAKLGDRRQADIALEGLRAWYLACLYADGELIGMPSKAVDEAWHEMILMTREYAAFCERAFGHYLHHSPDSTLAAPMQTLLAQTLAVVDRNELPMTLFTADADAGLEQGTTWSSTDLRRMRDANLASPPARPRRRRGEGGSGTESSWWGAGFFGGDGGGSDGGGGGGGCGGGGCGGGG